MFTCLIRYRVDPDKLDEFEQYARSWITLIERYGGTHHGYFMPGVPQREKPAASFSFPELGKEGPDDVAVALFSFPDVPTYERYRRLVADDDQCVAATARFNETRPFLSYERSFLRPVGPQVRSGVTEETPERPPPSV